MRSKFLLKLALSYVKAQLFDYLIELTKEQKEVFQNGVIELEKFINAVPINIWLSLKNKQSKESLLHILSIHDTDLLKAAYFILIEVISQKIDFSSVLSSYDDLFNDLSIAILEIVSNNEPKDDAEIMQLIKSKREDILNASISFVLDISSTYLTAEQKDQQYRVLSQTRKIVNRALDLS